METFDVVIIGAGPGGYVAALRCAQLGLSVSCVDDWKNKEGKNSLGGTCLNVGCIPSKALLESSELFETAQLTLRDHGILIKDISLDLEKMLARKEKIVSDLTAGISYLFKKNKIITFDGRAFLVEMSPKGWKVHINNGKRELLSKSVILATGSKPRELRYVRADGNRIVDNVGALSFTDVPKRLGIIGAGAIGLELGSVWRRLGSSVTMLEVAPAFMSFSDEAIAKEALRALSKQGLGINLGAKIDNVSQSDNMVHITWQDHQGKVQVLDVDKLILAVGRVPNSGGLADEKLGLQIDEKGHIVIDPYCRTNLPEVYAIGDVVSGPMLAHKASEEGIMVAERLAGQQASLDRNLVPFVIYTAPEIAWVGKTEQELKGLRTQYRIGQFSFQANGRARCLGKTNGFIKVLADLKTDVVLGVHIIGPLASELIQQAVQAMAFSATSEDLARIVYAHPSLSEVMHEAALAVDKRALHS